VVTSTRASHQPLHQRQDRQASPSSPHGTTRAAPRAAPWRVPAPLRWRARTPAPLAAAPCACRRGAAEGRTPARKERRRRRPGRPHRATSSARCGSCAG
jgi:hypothetical protein